MRASRPSSRHAIAASTPAVPFDKRAPAFRAVFGVELEGWAGLPHDARARGALRSAEKSDSTPGENNMAIKVVVYAIGASVAMLGCASEPMKLSEQQCSSSPCGVPVKVKFLGLVYDLPDKIVVTAARP